MKDFHILALSNDHNVRTYAIMHGEKPIGRAVRKGKEIAFQVTGYPPQREYGSNVERIISKWLDSHYVDLQEGDVVKHKFGLKQQQKNKTKYRFYQEIKDDIPVYDRGTHNAVLPKYIESHRHPENLEPFDHFEVQPSVSGVNGRILGITKDGMRVLTSVARLELAKVLADAYNRGGFSDKDIEKVPPDTLESINRGYESSWQKRYRTDLEFRERQKQNERNRRKNPEYAEKKREYQRERSRKLYADPDWRKEDLARRRDVYAANKDAVLAKRQALMKDPAYAARKAEYWKQDAAKRKELTQKFQQLVQDPDFDPGKLPTAELKKFIKFLEKGRI
jgi:hypothetical protein